VSTDSVYWRARAAQAITAAQQSNIPLVKEVMTKVADACASLAAPDHAPSPTAHDDCILVQL